MSKTITISDETFEALKDQIEKLEEPELYPIATVNDKGDCQRLILNLPDVVLSDKFQGRLISITKDGEYGTDGSKKMAKGTFYSCGENKQVFPV